MPNKFELSVPVPPDVVKKRLEAARKEMAPKIGTCAMSPDRSFECRIDYANAYALVKAEPTSDGSQTKAVVEIHGFMIWNTPMGIALAIAIPITGILVMAMSNHLNNLSEWIFVPALTLFWIGMSLSLVPASKHILGRFIRETLLDSNLPSSKVN